MVNVWMKDAEFQVSQFKETDQFETWEHKMSELHMAPGKRNLMEA
jgi:hypothetical protein